MYMHMLVEFTIYVESVREAIRQIHMYMYIYIHEQYAGRCDLTGTIGHVCNWHGDVLLFPEHPQHIQNPSKMNK